MDENELREFICARFLAGRNLPITDRTDLVDEGICDSLGLVELAAFVEKRCAGLRVRDREITRANFGSIAAVLAFLKARRVHGDAAHEHTR